MNKLSSGKICNNYLLCSTNFVVRLLLLVVMFLVFVPVSPVMPTEGLDPSWRFGMNQAVSQSLGIGTDIVFTFGPYSSVYSNVYHPATDLMMLSGGLYLALICWACLIFLAKNQSFFLLLSFCIVFSGLMYSRDTLMFFLPLLVGLSVFKVCSLRSYMYGDSRLVNFFILIIFSSLGFLPLVKGSFLVLCGAVSVLCAAIFLFKKHHALALISLLSPLCSMFFFWLVSGQPSAGLLSYFINMAPVVSGYTEAMASNGRVGEIFIYVLASLVLLSFVFVKSENYIPSKVFLVCLYFVFLFLSFKAGFVRHDEHALAAGLSILLAGLSTLLFFNKQFSVLFVIPSLIASFYIGSHYVKLSPAVVINNIYSNFSSLWMGVERRVTLAHWPRSAFDEAVESLRKEAKFPLLKGTSDIYSYNQSYLIASGNKWAPRPVFQSYSAYNSALAEMNKQYLSGMSAPDNIIFRVEPIDGRMPSIEDGASWPILMTNYRPTHLENNFLFLEKNKDSEGVELASLNVMNDKRKFGEVVELPVSDQPLFAKIEITPTVVGRVASILFKPSQLQLTVELGSGLKKQYRIISGMAKSGFLISPLIEDTVDFGMLYADAELLDGKIVKSISISPKGGNSIFWKSEYTISLTRVKSKVFSDVSKIYDFDDFESSVPLSDIVQAEKCDGSIDVINQITPAPEHINLNGIMHINGWLASSVEKGAIPEETYIVFTDSESNHKFLKTHAVLRRDVGDYFKRPALSMSGYSSVADISSVHGDQFIGLAMKVSGKIEICPQFKIKATIDKAHQ